MKMFELRKESGFSLVELMIVVAIIAILAAIAIPAFMQFAMKSKVSEANGNLAAIRTCEESYRAEDDVYMVCTPNPLGAPNSSPRKWDVPAAGFDDIGFEPDGDVRYRYEVTVPDPNVFEATATGDLDDDDVDAVWTITKGTSPYPRPENLGLGDY